MITSAAGERRNVMTAAWVMALDFEPAMLVAVGGGETGLSRQAVDGFVPPSVVLAVCDAPLSSRKPALRMTERLLPVPGNGVQSLLLVELVKPTMSLASRPRRILLKYGRLMRPPMAVKSSSRPIASSPVASRPSATPT